MIPNYQSEQRVLVLKFSYIKNILLKDIVNNHQNIIIIGNGGSNSVASHISQDYTKQFKEMLTEVEVVMLDKTEDIFTEFKKAYERDGSTLLIEHGDFYNDK